MPFAPNRRSLLLAGVSVVAGCSSASNAATTVVLPKAVDIVKMVVSHFNFFRKEENAYESLHGRKLDIPPFTIKPEHYELLLACFFQCRELNMDKEPMSNWIGMGDLDLHLKDKRKLNVFLMYTRKKEGEFKISEEGQPTRWYYGGNDHVIVSTIVNLYLLSQ